MLKSHQLCVDLKMEHGYLQKYLFQFVFAGLITLYMQMTHYTLEKQYVNLINFLSYLILMKCHLPFITAYQSGRWQQQSVQEVAELHFCKQWRR